MKEPSASLQKDAIEVGVYYTYLTVFVNVMITCICENEHSCIADCIYIYVALAFVCTFIMGDLTVCHVFSVSTPYHW